MLVNGKPYHTIWLEEDGSISIIDQRRLPHRFEIENITSCEAICAAIQEMHLRGAGLIGVAAAYGYYLAAREALPSDDYNYTISQSVTKLLSTRPTAVNLRHAIERQTLASSRVTEPEQRVSTALITAKAIAEEDYQFCEALGRHGLVMLQQLAAKKRRVNVLTHCNAGWLAFVDHGSATAPIYAAYNQGIDIHVWVDETRPRNQGARLTAWELAQHGVPHTVITDNAGGHLMQHGEVDVVITGADRVTRTGDVCNKIGTYLKALAANDNDIPFYAALPSSTIDWTLRDGIAEIPIEERSDKEVRHIWGECDGQIKSVQLFSDKSPAKNYGFDVTPARLVSGIITERGITTASEEGLLSLFPEKR